MNRRNRGRNDDAEAASPATSRRVGERPREGDRQEAVVFASSLSRRSFLQTAAGTSLVLPLLHRRTSSRGDAPGDGLPAGQVVRTRLPPGGDRYAYPRLGSPVPLGVRSRVLRRHAGQVALRISRVLLSIARGVVQLSHEGRPAARRLERRERAPADDRLLSPTGNRRPDLYQRDFRPLGRRSSSRVANANLGREDSGRGKPSWRDVYQLTLSRICSPISLRKSAKTSTSKGCGST